MRQELIEALAETETAFNDSTGLPICDDFQMQLRRQIFELDRKERKELKQLKQRLGLWPKKYSHAP